MCASARRGSRRLRGFRRLRGCADAVRRARVTGTTVSLCPTLVPRRPAFSRLSAPTDSGVSCRSTSSPSSRRGLSRSSRGAFCCPSSSASSSSLRRAPSPLCAPRRRPTHSAPQCCGRSPHRGQLARLRLRLAQRPHPRSRARILHQSHRHRRARGRLPARAAAPRAVVRSRSEHHRRHRARRRLRHGAGPRARARVLVRLLRLREEPDGPRCLGRRRAHPRDRLARAARRRPASRPRRPRVRSPPARSTPGTPSLLALAGDRHRHTAPLVRRGDSAAAAHRRRLRPVPQSDSSSSSSVWS